MQHGTSYHVIECYDIEAWHVPAGSIKAAPSWTFLAYLHTCIPPSSKIHVWLLHTLVPSSVSAYTLPLSLCASILPFLGSYMQFAGKATCSFSTGYVVLCSLVVSPKAIEWYCSPFWPIVSCFRTWDDFTKKKKVCRSLGIAENTFSDPFSLFTIAPGAFFQYALRLKHTLPTATLGRIYADLQNTDCSGLGPLHRTDLENNTWTLPALHVNPTDCTRLPLVRWCRVRVCYDPVSAAALSSPVHCLCSFPFHFALHKRGLETSLHSTATHSRSQLLLPHNWQ